MTPRAALRRRGIAIALAIGLITGAAMGLAFPLLALSLERMSGSGFVIGLNAMMGAISTLVAAPLTPILFTRTPPRRAIALSALLAAASFAALGGTENLTLWLILRFVFGAATTVVFLGAEIWANQLAAEHWRTRALGAYAAALSAGLAAGAAAFAGLGEVGYAGFMLGAALAGAPALVIAARAPRLRPPRAGAVAPPALWRAARLAPAAVTAGAVVGAIEAGAFNFLPVYGVRIGFSERDAGLVLAAVAIGTVLLYAPLGVVADRVNRRATLLACAVVGAAAPFLIGAAGENVGAAAAAAFAYGGVIVGFYAIGLATLSNRAGPARIVPANAAFVTAYGLGSCASPLVVGRALDLAGPAGALAALSAFSALYLLVLAGAAISARTAPAAD